MIERVVTSARPSGTAMPFKRHLTRTARLAAPVILARAGLLVMIAVDSAMLGHYGTESLAHYAAANAAQVVMVLIGVGLLQGTVILVAQAHGAHDSAACGAYWRVSFAHGAVLGVVMGLVCLLGRWTLEATGQEPEVAAGGGRVLEMIAWGSPPLMMWVVCTHFLEGLSRPIPGMLVMVGAVLLNVLLNWIFIFGNLGGPEMGAEGAAVATSSVRWVMFAALFLFVIRLPDAGAFGIYRPVSDFWTISRRLRRIGYPLGAARGLETAAFRRPGDVRRPSRHGSARRLSDRLQPDRGSCSWPPSGPRPRAWFASATRSGAATRPISCARAGRASCSSPASWSASPGPSSASAHRSRASTPDDPAVLPLAASLIGICGLILVFDGMQAVLMGALRGVADVWVPPGLQLISWWCVSVPIGYVLTFVAGLGVDGLMWGILAGALSASMLLSGRFLAVARRPIARY